MKGIAGAHAGAGNAPGAGAVQELVLSPQAKCSPSRPPGLS